MRTVLERISQRVGVVTSVVLVFSAFSLSLVPIPVTAQEETAAGGFSDAFLPSGLVQGRSAKGSDNRNGIASGLKDSPQENKGLTDGESKYTFGNALEEPADRPSIQGRNSRSNRAVTYADTAGASQGVQSESKISVDFPGGTIGEYVDVVKKEADSLNLIVTESAMDLKLPKIALKNVPVHVAVKCIEQCFDPNKTVVRVGGEIEGVQFIQAEVISTNQVEVINVRHLISGNKNDKEKENFLAAVETGLQMQTETTANLKIKFHEETGLLFLSGDRTEISLVQQIVSELSPKYFGGMSGGAGGMMGSGGMMSGSGGYPGGGAGMMGSGGHGMGVPGGGMSSDMAPGRIDSSSMWGGSSSHSRGSRPLPGGGDGRMPAFGSGATGGGAVPSGIGNRSNRSGPANGGNSKSPRGTRSNKTNKTGARGVFENETDSFNGDAGAGGSGIGFPKSNSRRGPSNKGGTAIGGGGEDELGFGGSSSGRSKPNNASGLPAKQTKNAGFGFDAGSGAPPKQKKNSSLGEGGRAGDSAKAVEGETSVAAERDPFGN